MVIQFELQASRFGSLVSMHLKPIELDALSNAKLAIARR
jgi:hypothetical protein